MQVQSLVGEDLLEKGMATLLHFCPLHGNHFSHSSILAWRIPWTEEPGELQSIGSQKVRHDCDHDNKTDHGLRGISWLFGPIVLQMLIPRSDQDFTDKPFNVSITGLGLVNSQVSGPPVWLVCDGPGKDSLLWLLHISRGTLLALISCRIFPTQGLNPGLPHCRRILYQLSHKGNPRIMVWVAYPFSRGSSQPRNQTGVSCIVGGFFTNLTIKEVM